MAVGQYLPPVVTRLSMEITDFADGVAKAKALVASLNKPINIPVSVDTARAVAGIKALQNAVDDLTARVGAATAAQAAFAAAVRDATSALDDQLNAILLLNPAITSLTRRLNAQIARQTTLSAAIHGTNAALYGQSAAAFTAGKALQQYGASGLLGAAAGKGGGGGRGWGFFGIPINATTLHWIIAGGAEILAVTIPALIALGAAAAVAAEGAAMVTQHMRAVYTATEATSQMFHVTAGQAVGLKGALQAAQTAADPSIYGILGSAVLTVNEHFGTLSQTGLQVIQTFQTFSAKIVSDFAPGGAVGGAMDHLLANMTGDLTGIGQLFGNLGHGILTLSAQMPGLAEILLHTFANLAGWITHAIDLLSRFRIAGMSIITVFMVWEEANRWGGLLVTILSRMGLAVRSTNLDALVIGWTHFRGIIASLMTVLPSMINLLGRMLSAVKLTTAGNALQGVAQAMLKWVAGLSAAQLGLIGIGAAAAVGIGIAIDKFNTAQDATQKFTESLQKNVMSSSNVGVTQVLLTNIGLLNGQLKQAQASADSAGAALHNAMAAAATQPQNNPGATQRKLYELAHAAQAAGHQALVLTAAQRQQETEMRNVQAGANYLASTYHTTLVGALALADLANVKLAKGILGTGQAAIVARYQIASLVQGYTAMGQPAGVVGADMTALAIQSGLAGSQVSKLNSAWDEFMTNLTGGTSGLASFVTSLHNIGNITANVSNNLGKAASINLNPAQFANALKSFGTTGAAAWTNFNQIVGSTMPQLIDWMRIAGAEGALSSTQFSRGVLGMVSSVTQFAAASPAAQAELLGIVQQVDPNITKWSQLTGAISRGKISLKDATSAVTQATIKMGDMAQVAQNLGNVLQSALLTALSGAKIQASGAAADMLKYEQMVRNGTAATAAGEGVRQKLIQDLKFLGYNADQAAQLIAMVAGKIKSLNSKTVTITVQAVGNGLSLINNQGVTSIKMVSGGLQGYARGTSGAARGWAWVGEAGPELVKFSGGERVIPNHVARGYASGTGPEDSVHEVHVYLDGKKIYRGTQREAVNTQRRTGSNGLAKRSR